MIAVLKGLFIVPVGTIGLCWPVDSPFQAALSRMWEWGLAGCLQGRGLGRCMPCFVVSILGVIYDCSPERVINGSCGNYGSLLAWG